jgi:hypothetical protein
MRPGIMGSDELRIVYLVNVNKVHTLQRPLLNEESYKCSLLVCQRMNNELVQNSALVKLYWAKDNED